MNEKRSPEDILRDAQRIDAFLKDEAVSGALARMERRFYEEFIDARGADQRVLAWAKASVLRTFEIEIKSVLDAGEIAVINAAKAAAKQNRE